jgi:hypothetical protein
VAIHCEPVNGRLKSEERRVKGEGVARGDPLALDNRPELSLLPCHREGVARGDPL